MTTVRHPASFSRNCVESRGGVASRILAFAYDAGCVYNEGWVWQQEKTRRVMPKKQVRPVAQGNHTAEKNRGAGVRPQTRECTCSPHSRGCQAQTDQQGNSKTRKEANARPQKKHACRMSWLRRSGRRSRRQAILHAWCARFTCNTRCAWFEASKRAGQNALAAGKRR